MKPYVKPEAKFIKFVSADFVTTDDNSPGFDLTPKTSDPSWGEY